MASSAAADSGDGRCVAASTTDHRVFGKTRGASLDETWLLMNLRINMNYRKRGGCYRGNAAHFRFTIYDLRFSRIAWQSAAEFPERGVHAASACEVIRGCYFIRTLKRRERRAP